MDGDDIKIEEYDVPLREWIALGKVERQIAKRFTRFLTSYAERESAERVYPRRINDMCSGARARATRPARPRSRSGRRQQAEPGGVIPPPLPV